MLLGLLKKQFDRPALGSRRGGSASQGADFSRDFGTIGERLPRPGCVFQSVGQSLFQISGARAPDGRASQTQDPLDFSFGNLLIQGTENVSPIDGTGGMGTFGTKCFQGLTI